MSVRRGSWSRSLLLPLLLLAAVTARADPISVYRVDGPMGAALWGLGEEPGTEIIAFAFTHVEPVKPDTPAASPEEPKVPDPGPRIVFSVTRWSVGDDGWMRRQWYGDAPLTAKMLAITPDLVEGTLDATVNGAMEERTESGVRVRRDVPGRLQMHWTGSGSLADTIAVYTYQTPTWATTLQTTGAGRAAKATATVTVEALGAPIELECLGSLATVTHGLLSVTLK